MWTWSDYGPPLTDAVFSPVTLPVPQPLSRLVSLCRLSDCKLLGAEACPTLCSVCGAMQTGGAISHNNNKRTSHDLQALSSFSHSVCASLSFTKKPQRMFCSPPEPSAPLLGSHASQGAFILPSYPFSSPRHSPKHSSRPVDSDHAVNFSHSWPLKSFEGLPKPTHQKTFSSPTAGDDAGKVTALGGLSRSVCNET